MLILRPEDVQYCCVTHQEIAPESILPGLNYNGHLFVKVQSYARNQLENAILRCREFLELKVPVLPIIVKEPTALTLWSKNESIIVVKSSSNSVVAPESTPTKKQKSKIKYRGVEVVRETKIVLPSQIVKNPKLKYRGQSY